MEFDKYKSNPKESWKIIIEFTNRNVKINEIEYLITKNDKKYRYIKENSEIISENINDYFINIAIDLLNQIKQNQK